MINLFYWICKLVFRLLVCILPIEFINRLFYVMPGRLVVDILKWYGAEVGENVKIAPPLLVHNWHDDSKRPFQNLYIGNNTNIGRSAFLDLHGKIRIEGNCTIAMGVMILTHTNVGDIYIKEVIPAKIGEVIIEQGVYVGARALLVASITVGANSALGAGSVVLKDVPPFSIYAGVPAKRIRSICESAK